MNNVFSNVIVHYHIYDDEVKNEILKLMAENRFKKRDGDVLLSYDNERIFLKENTVIMQMYAHNVWRQLNYFEFWDGDFDPIINRDCGYTSTKQHEDYLNLINFLPDRMIAFLPFNDAFTLSSLLKSAIASHRVALEILPYGGFHFCGENLLRELELDGKVLVYFRGCEGTSVVIPEGITEICNDSFAIEKKRVYTGWSKCVEQLSRVEKITFPESLTKIGDRAFYKCNLQGEVKLYSRLSSIGASAFEGNAIESVVLEEGIKKIDKLAFANMITLTHITIPASVKKIGNNAFSGCPNLVICTAKGSCAEAYAKENSIKFELIQ